MCIVYSLYANYIYNQSKPSYLSKWMLLNDKIQSDWCHCRLFVCVCMFILCSLLYF